MGRKFITAVGMGAYLPTQYRYDAEPVGTPEDRIVNAALLRSPLTEGVEEVLVVTTAEAWRAAEEPVSYQDRRTGAALELAPVKPILRRAAEERLGRPWTRAPVCIGIPLEEEDCRRALASLGEAVEVGDELIFDITYSYRSFPFLVMLLIIFLREAKKVTVPHVLYAEYNPGDRQTPIRDLAPFLSILEWANAAHRFNRLGDGGLLADLTERDLEAPRTASAIRAMSDGLSLAQLDDVDEAADALEAAVTPAGLAALSLESRGIEASLLASAVEGWTRLARAGARADRRLSLLRWYAELGLWPQAVILAAEGVVDTACERWGLDSGDFRSGGERDIAKWLLEGTPRGRKAQLLKGLSLPAEQAAAEQRLERVYRAAQADGTALRSLQTVWLRPRDARGNFTGPGLGDIRNLVAHAGRAQAPGSPASLVDLCRAAVSRVLTALERL